jgi:hypothetical protein
VAVYGASEGLQTALLECTAAGIPFLLEASHSSVFAAGDVFRLRQARGLGVGEGAMAVQFVHEYLRTM